MKQPRDEEGYFIITGPTVLSAFFWAALAGALSLAIVVAIGAISSALHRAQIMSCVSPAGQGPAAIAASGGCSAGEPVTMRLP